MKSLVEYIEKFVKLDSDAILELHKRAEIEVFSKNQHVLELGQRCNKIWFVKSGMVRKYHLHNGKDITTWIHTEGEILTSLQSYSQNVPADEYIQACEDSVLIGISRQNSEKLAKFEAFVTFSNVLMGKEVVNIDIHTKEFNKKNAKGKYEYLSVIAPEMVKRAKLGHIASLLGISQETLSRIRKAK